MEANTTYCIYNHSVQPELLFRDEIDVQNFKTKIHLHLGKICEVKQLLWNSTSFYLLITVYDLEVLKSLFHQTKFSSTKRISQQLANCFNSYAQSYNYRHSRKGNLFQKGFKQIELTNDIDWLEFMDEVIEPIDFFYHAA